MKSRNDISRDLKPVFSWSMVIIVVPVANRSQIALVCLIITLALEACDTIQFFGKW
jgi:hypothetical protein